MLAPQSWEGTMTAHKQSLDATFFALRKRERGGVLTGAAIAFVALSVVLFVAYGAAFVLLAAPELAELPRLAGAMAGHDMAALQSLMTPQLILMMVVGNFFVLFVYLILLAAFEAACLRWMIHGERGGLFGLSLGADTWRVYGAYWMWLIFWVIGSIALAILLGVAVAAISALAKALHMDWLGVVLGVIAGIGGAVFLPIWVSVRLAPAAATSVARRRFGFFHAWTTSRGRFWGLFGAFFLLLLLNMVVSGAIAGVFFNLLLGPAAFNFAADAKDATQFAAQYQAFIENYVTALMSPGKLGLVIAFQLTAGAIGLVFHVLYYGVSARAAALALEEGKFGAAPAAAEAAPPAAPAAG
jgi:hypothetical protein